MASNSYSCIHGNTGATLPYKSNSSSQLYSSRAAVVHRNMGVLVTAPWPMSQTIGGPGSGPHHSSKGSKEHHYLVKHGSLRHHHSYSHGSLRPVSMPPSYGTTNNGNANGRQRGSAAVDCYEAAMEMMPLNPINGNGHSNVSIPSRSSSMGTNNPVSPPTCAPWLKKMRVIKKIQQRMMTRGSRNGGMSPNNLPPLLFHTVHGENVAINQNKSVARRINGFCKAVAFSDRPVKIAEKVCIKFLEVATSWHGVLRIGFTSHDPATLRSGLPRYACPDLTSRPGYWAKAFHDFLVKKDSILFYYTNSAGDVHFGINGEEKGVFFTGVDTRGPLWAMLDVYGNTTCIEFVDLRAPLNNSRRSIINESSSRDVEIESSMCEIIPAMNGLKLLESSLPEVPYYSDADIEPLNFHRVRGKNVLYTADSLPTIAIRRQTEYCNAYVFTARPIFPNETVLIQILHKDDTFTSSMGFGLTVCNPPHIVSDSLPDDSYLLLDRPEYWVVKKDIANSPNVHDVLAFTVSSNGEVTMAINGGPPTFQMHVDVSVPLWAFFDLYGTTDRIRCIGTMKHDSAQQPQSSTQFRRNKDSFVLRAPKFPSTSSCSKYNFQKSPSMPSTSVGVAPREYFELSQSPNSMKTIAKAAFNTYESIVSGSHSLKEPPSNWSIECVACCEKPVDSVFYSCGHMCMCYECSVEYWKSKEKGCCPICRAVISDVIRTYKS